MYTDDSIAFVKCLFCFFVLTSCSWPMAPAAPCFDFPFGSRGVYVCISSENKTEIKFTKKHDQEKSSSSKESMEMCVRALCAQRLHCRCSRMRARRAHSECAFKSSIFLSAHIFFSPLYRSQTSFVSVYL